MDIGSKLKALRSKKHLSQEEMSNVLGIKRARYNAWENNIANPDLEMTKKLADFHRVTTDYLLRDAIESYSSESAPRTAIRDFRAFMSADGLVIFDGMPMSDEDKQRIIGFVESMFWDVKNKDIQR